MEHKGEDLRILYIGDLNLEQGGAQKHTFYTIRCIAKEFDVLMYIIGEPSHESLSLIRGNGIGHIIVRNPSYDHLKKTCLRKNIKFIILQWENPQWIIMAYKLSKEVGARYILLLHEVPIIGTPVKTFIRNFLAEILIITFIRIVSWPKRRISAAVEFKCSQRLGSKQRDLDAQKEWAPHFLIRMPVKIIRVLSLLYQALLVYRGLYHTSGVLAISPVSAFYLQTYFPKLKNYLTLRIPNGVDTSLIDDLPRCEKVTFSHDISFMAAGLVPEKGTLDLLEVVYRVNRKMRDELGKDVKVAILGRFVNEHTKLLFLRKAKELDVLKNIDILGYLPEKEKFRILCSTRVFLYPSIKDCFSISLIEAMACGCPAVVYDLPFTKQFKTNALFKVKYKDLDTMAAVTADILMLSYRQQERYLTLRGLATNFARQFTWDKVCENEAHTLKYMLTKLTNEAIEGNQR